MTKRRAPVTFENALAQIAGKIGWEGVAEVLGLKERMARYYGEPDSPYSPNRITISQSSDLDHAFEEAGGLGTPMFETYALLHEARRAERFSDQVELARRTCTVLRECGQAGEALVLATLPGATEQDRAAALREVEEGVTALKATMPLLSEGKPP